MTNKTIFKVLVLAAFVAMVAIAPLQAATDCQKQATAGCQKQGEQKKMMGHDCAMGQGCMMLKAIPNLTDEQKGKLEKLHAEQQKLMAAAKAGMEKLHAEMQGLMKEPVDLKKVEAKIDEAAKMKADMMKKGLAHRLEVRALLTAEQKAKLGEMGCGLGCGMGGAMMHGHGRCGMDKKQMEAKAGCGMKHGREAKHEGCQKAAEEKK
jgi:Spy/CpxP family protein refolding chaperone